MQPVEGELMAKLKKTLAGIWAVDDKHDWPVKFSAISHLFLGEFYNDFHTSFYGLLEEGKSHEEISGLLGKPSGIFRSFDLILKGMMLNNVPSSERRRFISDILYCIKCRKHGSIFNEDGRNLIYDERAVCSLMEGSGWNRCDIQEARSIHMLAGLIKAYIEVLYFRMYDLSQEIHGPYANDGKSIVVREFANLAPVELWEDFDFPPCASVTIYTEYDEQVRMNIDPYNHLSLSGGILAEHLLRWRLVIDGEAVADIRVVLALIERLKYLIQRNGGVIKGWDWRAFSKKYAELCWYKIRKLQINGSGYRDISAILDSKIANGSMRDRTEEFFDIKKIHMLINILF